MLDYLKDGVGYDCVLFNCIGIQLSIPISDLGSRQHQFRPGDARGNFEGPEKVQTDRCFEKGIIRTLKIPLDESVFYE